MPDKPTYEELEQRVQELEQEVAKGKSTEEDLRQKRNLLGQFITRFIW